VLGEDGRNEAMLGSSSDGAVKVIRGLWPGRSPLWRAVDRMEALAVAGLAVAFLAGAPVAGLAAGHVAYSIGSRTASAQQAAWHRVPAMLLAAVPAAGYDDNQVPASWTAPDGTRHIGPVPAPPGARAGRTVMVWMAADGRLTGTPLQSSQVWGLVVLASGLAPFAVGIIVLCAGQLARHALDRRRLAAWDADWRATEPLWTGRP
jgi:hypothetical protein